MRRCRKIYIFALLSFPIINYILYLKLNPSSISIFLKGSEEEFNVENRTSHLTPQDVKNLQDNRCKIPILDPFEQELRKYFRPMRIDCENQKRTFYFKAYVDTRNGPTHFILMKKELPKNFQCCYKNIAFKNIYDYSIISDEKESCIEITSNMTKIPSNLQYVVISCKKRFTLFLNPPQDELLIFVPPPSEHLLNHKKNLREEKSNRQAEHTKLNVIILGFDQISRSDFIRQMKLSFEYLKTKLKAIDLQGFNKIGDATLNNTLALLAGVDFGTVLRNPNWWNSSEAFFDKVPWIWKNFSDIGYITSYADDYTSVFDYRFNGFRIQPTDYYFHPLIKWLEAHFQEFSSSRYCIGNDILLDLMHTYARKTSLALKDHPYFQFVWTSASHQQPGYLAVADEGLLETLQTFEENGILNKSLVILVSDHGWRAGDIMLKPETRLENKMTFAFFLLPEWFREKYRNAYQNLQDNQYRLTSHYDIYKTLLDVLDLEKSLGDEDDVGRNEEEESENLSSKSKGTSLFLPISKNRTCDNAGVDPLWCACDSYKAIEIGKEAIKLAKFAIYTINSWLRPFKSCVQYKLGKIFSLEVEAYMTADGSLSNQTNLKSQNKFRIVLEMLANESPAWFELVIFTRNGWFNDTDKGSNQDDYSLMEMSTEVFRINSYGSSPCMKTYSLKKICTCSSGFLSWF